MTYGLGLTLGKEVAAQCSEPICNLGLNLGQPLPAYHFGNIDGWMITTLFIGFIVISGAGGLGAVTATAYAAGSAVAGAVYGVVTGLIGAGAAGGKVVGGCVATVVVTGATVASTVYQKLTEKTEEDLILEEYQKRGTEALEYTKEQQFQDDLEFDYLYQKTKRFGRDNAARSKADYLEFEKKEEQIINDRKAVYIKETTTFKKEGQISNKKKAEFEKEKDSLRYKMSGLGYREPNYYVPWQIKTVRFANVDIEQVESYKKQNNRDTLYWVIHDKEGEIVPPISDEERVEDTPDLIRTIDKKTGKELGVALEDNVAKPIISHMIKKYMNEK